MLYFASQQKTKISIVTDFYTVYFFSNFLQRKIYRSCAVFDGSCTDFDGSCTVTDVSRHFFIFFWSIKLLYEKALKQQGFGSFLWIRGIQNRLLQNYEIFISFCFSKSRSNRAKQNKLYCIVSHHLKNSPYTMQ